MCKRGDIVEWLGYDEPEDEPHVRLQPNKWYVVTDMYGDRAYVSAEKSSVWVPESTLRVVADLDHVREVMATWPAPEKEKAYAKPTFKVDDVVKYLGPSCGYESHLEVGRNYVLRSDETPDNHVSIEDPAGNVSPTYVPITKVQLIINLQDVTGPAQLERFDDKTSEKIGWIDTDSVKVQAEFREHWPESYTYRYSDDEIRLLVISNKFKDKSIYQRYRMTQRAVDGLSDRLRNEVSFIILDTTEEWAYGKHQSGTPSGNMRRRSS